MVFEVSVKTHSINDILGINFTLTPNILIGNVTLNPKYSSFGIEQNEIDIIVS